MKRLLLSVFLLLAATPALARPRLLGTFGAWRAYSYDEGGQKTCYMTDAKIIRTEGPWRPRRYLMITHRPTEGSTDVFSYDAGADIASPVQLAVGKTAFPLFTAHHMAWAREIFTDHAIARALRGGAATARLALRVRTTRGTRPAADVFDIKGAPAAYAAIGRACGLPHAAPRRAKPSRRAPRKAPARRR